MRYSTPVFFQKIIPGEYDTSTGNYGDGEIIEAKRYADVTDAGVNTLNLIYGELRQGCKVVRLQNHYNDPFNRIRIDRKVYKVDFQRQLQNKHTFVVSEVQ